MMKTTSQLPCFQTGTSRFSKSTFRCSSFSVAGPGSVAVGVRERPYSLTREKRSDARMSRSKYLPVAPVAPRMRADSPGLG